jgi:hypothetical protein
MERCKEYAIAHATAKEYPVLKARGAALEKDVNSAIEDGWQPIGGLTVDAQGNMYQALAQQTQSVVINEPKESSSSLRVLAESGFYRIVEKDQ